MRDVILLVFKSIFTQYLIRSTIGIWVVQIQMIDVHDTTGSSREAEDGKIGLEQLKEFQQSRKKKTKFHGLTLYVAIAISVFLCNTNSYKFTQAVNVKS